MNRFKLPQPSEELDYHKFDHEIDIPEKEAKALTIMIEEMRGTSEGTLNFNLIEDSDAFGTVMCHFENQFDDEIDSWTAKELTWEYIEANFL